MRKSDFLRVVFGVLSHHDSVCRFEVRARLFECYAGAQTPEQLRHAMDSARHHRG